MIEHSATPEIEDKLAQLFSSLITAHSKSPIVPPANVKMRASAYSRYLVAGEVRSFLHIAVAMMEGPSEQEKAELSDLLFNAATGVYPSIGDITLDIRDTNPQTYRKR